MIVDAQVHIWAADHPDRPWVPGQAGRAHRPTPLGHEQLLREMDEAGVDRAILVPPSYEGDRNDLVLAAAKAHPDRYACMGRLPIEDPACAALLPDWREQPGMLGLRLTFHLEQQRRWLSDGTVDWFWPAAERAGIPLMVLPTHSLDIFSRLAHRHPGLSFIIDHCSLHRSLPLRGPFHLDEAEVQALCRLARHPNVAVKVSALPLFSNDPYPYRDMQALARRVYDAFGPQRSFWGSDMTRLPCSYRQAVTFFTDELHWLSGDDRRLVMGQAICDWLGWPLPPETRAAPSPRTQETLA